MKINSKHYVLLVFALPSLILAIFGYFIIYRQTIDQAEHYVSATKEVQNEDERKQNEKELSKIFESTKDSRSKIENFFVKEDRIVDFIELVERVGTDSKTELEISGLSNDAETVKAKVEVKGSWASVMTALTLLENLPLSSSLNNVRLNTTNESAKGSSAWSLTLDIEAVLIKQIQDKI